MSHSGEVQRSIGALVADGTLAEDRDAAPIAIIGELASLMDEQRHNPVAYAKLSTEARLWWLQMVGVKEAKRGASVFDV